MSTRTPADSATSTLLSIIEVLVTGIHSALVRLVESNPDVFDVDVKRKELRRRIDLIQSRMTDRDASDSERWMLVQLLDQLDEELGARLTKYRDQKGATEQVENAADAPTPGAEEIDPEGLRDYVPVGLDIPISVLRQSAKNYPGIAEYWYYVDVELPDGGDVVVGLVERRENQDGGYLWAGLAEPGYGTVCWEDTMQEAIDALVRYSLNVEVELKEEMRTDEVTGERII